MRARMHAMQQLAALALQIPGVARHQQHSICDDRDPADTGGPNLGRKALFADLVRFGRHAAMQVMDMLHNRQYEYEWYTRACSNRRRQACIQHTMRHAWRLTKAAARVLGAPCLAPWPRACMPYRHRRGARRCCWARWHG